MWSVADHSHVGGGPGQQVTGQTFLPPEQPVVAWVDAVQVSRKMGSLSFQSVWCVETTFLWCPSAVFIYIFYRDM